MDRQALLDHIKPYQLAQDVAGPLADAILELKGAEGDDAVKAFANDIAGKVKAGEVQFDLETRDLVNQELFSAGTWNDEKFTIEDLDGMVEAFAATKAAINPRVKLGHTPKQLLLQANGYPAAGWIENVRREGSKLMGDIRRMPRKIFELVQAGGYREKSAEILQNVKIGGKLYRNVLKAVAILGEEMKGVRNIDDLVALYSDGGGRGKPEGAGDSKTYAFSEKHEEEENMELKEATDQLAQTQKDLAAAKDQLKTFGDENGKLKTDLKAAQDKAAGLEAQVSEFAEKEKTAAINAALDKAITDKKIVPAQRPALFHLLQQAKSIGEKKFSVDGKEQTMEELIFSVVGPSVELPTDQQTQAGQRQTDDLNQKALEYQAKHQGVSYKDALMAVAPDQPAEKK